MDQVAALMNNLIPAQIPDFKKYCGGCKFKNLLKITNMSQPPKSVDIVITDLHFLCVGFRGNSNVHYLNDGSNI